MKGARFLKIFDYPEKPPPNTATDIEICNGESFSNMYLPDQATKQLSKQPIRKRAVLALVSSKHSVPVAPFASTISLEVQPPPSPPPSSSSTTTTTTTTANSKDPKKIRRITNPTLQSWGYERTYFKFLKLSPTGFSFTRL